MSPAAAARIVAAWASTEERSMEIVSHVLSVAGEPPTNNDAQPLLEWPSAAAPWVVDLPEKLHAVVVDGLVECAVNIRHINPDSTRKAFMSVMPRRVGRRHAA